MGWGKLDNFIAAATCQNSIAKPRSQTSGEAEATYIETIKKLREFPDCTDDEECIAMWAVEYSSYFECPSCKMDVNVDWNSFASKRCPFCNQKIQLDVYIT